MATIIEKRELSQQEFMALQEEGGGYEYEDGELVQLVSVEGRQSSAWGEVHLAVGSSVRLHRLGRVWIDLLTSLDAEGSVRYFPDIVYLSRDALDRYDGGKIVGPPTLVVEVTAPGIDAREEGAKKANYHRFGVPWYWVVSTGDNVTREYRWEAEGYAVVSETPFAAAFRPALFPGLEIVVAAADDL